MGRTRNMEAFREDFLNSTPQNPIDKQYYDIEEQYRKLFGHGVPREMLPDSIDMDQIKKAMLKCIESKTDNLFQLLGVEINENCFY